MAVVITHARTALVPSSVSVAGVSVWTRTGNPASVSISSHVEQSRQVGITPGICYWKTCQTVVVVLRKKKLENCSNVNLLLFFV